MQAASAATTASFLLSKYFDGGVFTSGGSTFVSFGYAYSDSQDRRNMYSSTAGSNYDFSAASIARTLPPRAVSITAVTTSLEHQLQGRVFWRLCDAVWSDLRCALRTSVQPDLHGGSVFNDDAFRELTML
jgi:hypothetical protein